MLETWCWLNVVIICLFMVGERWCILLSNDMTVLVLFDCGIGWETIFTVWSFGKVSFLRSICIVFCFYLRYLYAVRL